MSKGTDNGGDAPAHAPTVLAGPATEPRPRPEVPIVDPRRYDLQGEFARGGLGRIVRAHDRRLRRGVAIKEPLPERAQDADLLLREAFVTAHLEHPNIVPVHDAGYWPDGTPFYAMKLVRGRSLATVIDGARTLEQRLALLPHLVAIADAIAYAHSERVLHRDLKPGNILVGEFGETVVVDWGLARWHEDGSAEVASPEGPSSVAGTPGYMAPEQARGEAVDERADIYALGAILYHVLVGEAPHHGADSAELLLRVGREPPRAVAERAPEIPADLAAIATKALAFRPEDRYRGAAEVAEELRRFQTGQLVAAHRYGRTALALRWLRRNRLTVRVAAVLLVLLLGLAGIGLARRFADQRRDAARLRQLILRQAERALTRDPTEAIAWLRALELDEENSGPAMVIATSARSAGVARRVLRSHENVVWSAAVSPDGKTLATSSSDHDVVLVELAGGETHRFSARGEALSVRFMPRGGELAVGSADGSAYLLDAEGRERVRFFPKAGPLWTADPSPDGTLIASGGHDGALHLWGRDGTERFRSRTRPGHLRSSGFALGGKRVIAASDAGSLIALDLATGEDLDLADDVTAMAIDHQGGRVAAPRRGKLSVWDLSRKDVAVERPQEHPAEWVWFSADDRQVWSGDREGRVEIWDLPSNAVTSLPPVNAPLVAGIALADGRRSVVGFDDGTVGVADRVTRTVTRSRGHEGSVMSLTLLPDGGFASTGTEGTVRLWPPPPERPTWIARGAEIVSFSLDPTEQIVVAARTDGRVETSAGQVLAASGPEVSDLVVSSRGRVAFARGGRLTTVELDGSRAVECPEPAGASRLAFSPDGATLYCGGAADGSILAMGPACESPRKLAPAEGILARLNVAPDGRSLAVVGQDRRVRLVLGTEVRVLGAHDRSSLAVAFSPDGKSVASGGHDQAVRLWPLDGGAPRVLVTHRGYVDQLAFSADGTLLVSAGASPTVYFTHLPDGATRSFRRHTENIRSVAISRDGAQVVTACNDGDFRLWDVATGESALLANGPWGPTLARYTRDGRWVFGSGQDGTVRRWAVDVPSEPKALSRWLASITEEHVDPRTLDASEGGGEP